VAYNLQNESNKIKLLTEYERVTQEVLLSLKSVLENAKQLISYLKIIGHGNPDNNLESHCILFSGLWRRKVWYKFTDVSEKHTASMFSVEEQIGVSKLKDSTLPIHRRTRLTSLRLQHEAFLLLFVKSALCVTLIRVVVSLLWSEPPTPITCFFDTAYIIRC
jgi:hypothetical protein